MNRQEGLAARFEAHREHLRGVAYRMLGSLDEADDAVQLAWLRADRAGVSEIENLAGWLTTVVGRLCLDMLRTRRARGEVPLSAGASKKLASRARNRVRGVAVGSSAGGVDLARHYAVVDSFLTAARGGDLDALVELLAPDVVRRADRVAVPAGIATEVRGARAVADETRVFAHRARSGEVALVDGTPGIVIAPRGRLHTVLRLTIEHGRITEIDVIADPTRLDQLPLAVGRA